MIDLALEFWRLLHWFKYIRTCYTDYLQPCSLSQIKTPPNKNNFRVASKNVLCIMHSCLSKTHQENNLSLTQDFPLNSVTPLLRFRVLLILSILQRKINTQRFLDINLFRSDQFNLPPIREEGVVGEEQCWGLNPGTQKKELHSDTSCSD